MNAVPKPTLRPSAILAWEEPPPKRAPRKREAWFTKLLPQLRVQPKRWAKVLIVPTYNAANARSAGYLKSVKSGNAPRGYEFCSRQMSDGRWGVYARYVG